MVPSPAPSFYTELLTPPAFHNRSGRENEYQGASRLPTAAERAVKCDSVEQAGGLELQKILLCGVKIPLREENVHVVIHALSITSIGEVETLLLGVQQKFLRLEFFVENGADGQRVRHFAERGLNGSFVVGNLNPLLDLRHSEPGPS